MPSDILLTHPLPPSLPPSLPPPLLRLTTATSCSTILSNQARPVNGTKHDQKLHPASRHSPYGLIETQGSLAPIF